MNKDTIKINDITYTIEAQNDKYMILYIRGWITKGYVYNIENKTLENWF